MTWQKYEQHKAKSSIHASIAPTGLISLTRGVQEEFKVQPGKTDYAQLYFNAEINCIGIEFLRTATTDSLKIIFRGPKKNNGFSISAKSFLNHFERLPTGTRIYNVLHRDNMLVIDLNSMEQKAASIHTDDALTLASRISFKGTKPSYYKFNNTKKIYINNWRTLYRDLIIRLYKEFPMEMDKILKHPNDPNFKGLVSSPDKITRFDLWEQVIPNYDTYFYTNKNANDIIRSLRVFFKHIGIPSSSLEFGLRN